MTRRPPVPRGSMQFSGGQTRAAIRALLGPDPRQAVAEFETAFARHVGARHAIAVSSGKAALALILRGLDAREGEGLILPSYNVPEVPSIVAGLGLRPVFADLDPRTAPLDPDDVGRAAKDGARFLLCTHLYGNPADLAAMSAVADRHGLVLLEDCAQSLGARFRGRPVGSFGRAALYSFGPMKNLNTLRGGMVVTDDDDLAGRVRLQVASLPRDGRLPVATGLVTALGLWVATRRRIFGLAVLPGVRAVERLAPGLLDDGLKMRPAAFESGRLDAGPLTFRMNGTEAVIGLAGLEVVETATRLRVRNADRLAAALGDVPGVQVPRAVPGSEPAWINFVVRVADRPRVRRALLRRGIDTTPGYLSACHEMPAFGPGSRDCPVSTALVKEALYLPIWPELGPDDMDFIAWGVAGALGG